MVQRRRLDSAMVQWLTIVMSMMNEDDEPDQSESYDVAACQAEHQALAAWMGMERLVERTQRQLTAHLRCHQLNAGQLDLLFQIGAAEGLTQQELAERICHSKANVSQLLDKMEAAGLVRRVPEGRAYAVHLTEAGRSLLDAVMPEQERLVLAQCERLTAEERTQLFRLMSKLEPIPD